MPRPIENPVTGERIDIRERADEVLRFEYSLAPGGFAVGRVDHVHPHQEERFHVRSGELGVRIDGDEWTATAGTRFAIPPGTAHTVWNAGGSALDAMVEIRPALDIAGFFETTYGLARDGKTIRWGLPGPLQLAVLADAFREEIRFAPLPDSLERALAAVLAPIGRSLGYRATYPRYGTSTP